MASVVRALRELSTAPIARHPLAGLLTWAWAARKRLRLVEALYVELSDSLDAALITTDTRLARESAIAELVRPSE